MRTLLLAALLLVPLTASALDWTICGSSRVITGVSPGRSACLSPVTADPDADGLLDTAACDNFDAIWLLDQNGDNTASTGTMQLETCPNNSALDTEAKFAFGCRDLTAVLDTSNESNLGVAAHKLWANATSPNEDPQLIIVCH